MAVLVLNLYHSHTTISIRNFVSFALLSFGLKNKMDSHGVEKEITEGARDQYEDGIAADIWEILIGDTETRTQIYKDFLISLLRKKGCKRILDAACGTG